MTARARHGATLRPGLHWHHKVAATLWACLATCLLLALLLGASTSSWPAGADAGAQQPASGAAYASAAAAPAAASADGGVRLGCDAGVTSVRSPTLIVYVYGGSDAEYPTNLRFFLSEAVKEGDGCDYIIVLQQGEGVALLDPLPPLPSNARYLHHPNECLDIGTVGWVLDHHVPDIAAYSYFIWLNPSVRGPFLPAYLRGRMHWTEPLLSRLSPSVKLVGATINCGGPYERPIAVHVQSYLSATDRVGLQVLRDTGTVFHCWNDVRRTILESEVGASAAIFAAGYTIDSLMLRYQGVDWRHPAIQQAACNAGLNPLPAGMNDGIDVDPLEVMFIKVKAPFRAASWPHVEAAVKFAEWAALADQQAARRAAGLPPSQALLQSVGSSEWRPRSRADAEKLLSRGPKCFDAAFYISSSADLAFLRQLEDPLHWAWHHFQGWGLREGRPYRFNC